MVIIQKRENFYVNIKEMIQMIAKQIRFNVKVKM